MTKSNSKKYSTILYVALAIFTAMVLRQIARWADAPLDWFCGMIRSAIYIELFIAWGVFLHRGIIQPQVRRYLTSISVLMVFWITVRTIRYSLDECIWLMRYLWYLYYLPMLLIPLLAVFVALALGKPDNFRLSKWTGFFTYLPLHCYCLC